METIRLPHSDLTVSRLGMGGCPAGEYGWGHVSRADVERAFHEALDAGVNLFDTADTYGLGRSEESLAEALGTRRREAVIATKFGVRVENGQTTFDNSPAYLRAALDASLKRLRTDYIDLYQVHYLDGKTSVCTLMETLIALKKQGKIRAIGLSNLKRSDAAAFTPYHEHISSFQHHFSLAHRDDEALIQHLSNTLGASPFTWGSLGQGVLTGKYDRSVSFDRSDRRSRAGYDNFHGDKLLQNLAIVDAMRPIAEARRIPLSAVALRWILDTLPGSVALTGVKSPSQGRDNRLALTFALAQEERALLDKISAYEIQKE